MTDKEIEELIERNCYLTLDQEPDEIPDVHCSMNDVADAIRQAYNQAIDNCITNVRVENLLIGEGVKYIGHSIEYSDSTGDYEVMVNQESLTKLKI